MRRLVSVFLLFALTLCLCSCFPPSETEVTPQEIDWGTLELREYIPKPATLLGFISYNYNSSLSIEICKNDKNEYKKYVDACIDMGYTIDSETYDTQYIAFNSEGYRIAVTWYSDEYHITLQAPENYEEFEWPATGLATKLPKTISNIGKIKWDNSETYIVHVADTTIDAYKGYVKSCEEAGFAIDYSQGEKNYTAFDVNGYKLSVTYMGFNRIEVSIRAPKKEETRPSTTNPTTTTKPKDPSNPSELIDGMRPEFKAAMDSYEEFFAEYCNFMKKYKQNPTDIGLIAEYAEFMKQYVDTMEKMEAWDDGDLNSEELKYYIDVTGRITKMLVDVAG